MNSEQLLLQFVDNIGKMDFSMVIELIKYGFVGFWLVVLGWVWVDSGERTTNILTRLASVVIVGVLNVVGLVIYLLLRPKQTIQELYWADLERRYLKYETLELGDCPVCEHSLQPGFNVCPSCGYQLKKQCSKCSVWVDKSYAYCPYCSSGFVNVINRNQKPDNSDVMEQELNKSKEVAIETVEGNKTKYVDRRGVLSKVKMDITSFLKKIGDSVLGKNKVKKMDKNINRQLARKTKKNKKKKK